MTDFNDLLDSEAGTHKAPPSMPAGVYVVVVREMKQGSQPDKDNPGQKKGFVDVIFGVVEPGAGVDTGDLASREIDFSKKTLRNRFWITPAALFFLDDPQTGFIAKCGIAMQGKSVGDALGECQGAEVKAVVTETPAPDGSERTYNNISSFLSMNE